MDFIFPSVAYASVDSFVMSVNRLIINPIITFLFALALLIFLFGMLQFFWGSGSEEKRTLGKQHMLWGIVGLTIMMGVFAILNLVMRTLNVENINLEEGTVDFPNYNP